MRIGVVTAMWRRPEVFDIFASGVNRLREKFDITPVAVGSEGEKSRELCRKHEFVYLERPNSPLGRKFNDGLSVFQKFPVDYVLVMGSDDLISDCLIERYMPHMEAGAPLIGILDIYYYELLKGKLHYWPGYGFTERNKQRKGEPLGLARCISMETIHRLKWKLWDYNINSGLDWTMWQRLKRIGIKPVTMKLENSMAVDLKNNQNICKLGLFETEIVDEETMFSSIGVREKELIKRYGEKGKI